MINNVSNDTKTEAVNLSKLKQYKRKPMWPFAFFLLPTVLVLLYGAIVGIGILPPYVSFNLYLNFIGLDDYRIVIHFPGLFDDYMVIVSFIALLVLPMITVLCMIIRASGNSSRAAALEEAEHRQHLESLYRTGDDATVEDVAPTVAAPVHESDIPTSSSVTVAHDSSVVAFSYNKLKNVDMQKGSLGYDEREEYNDSLTLSELCADFIAYAASRGMSIPDATARSIFAAMCASHVIWVTGKDREAARRTLEILSDYFGAPLHIDKGGSSVTDRNSVSVRADRLGGAYSETPFLVDVYSANYARKGVRFAAIDNITTECAADALADYFEGADVVTRERHARVPAVQHDAYSFVAFVTGEQLRLYPNTWYMIIPQDVAPLPVSAIALDLSAVAQDDSLRGEMRSTVTVSAARLYELSAAARAAHEIPEDYWKKLDALEAYIASKTPYRIDNKSIRRIEAYASVAMSAGAGIVEALDAAIAAKILPALAACPAESISGDEDGIVAFIDRTFGIDNMPCSYDCIRKLGVA